MRAFSGFILFLCSTTFLLSCSKSPVSTAVTNEADQKQIISSMNIEEQLNHVSKKLDANLISASEAGKQVRSILESAPTNDLQNFNYEEKKRVFSNFTQGLSLKDNFGAESEKSLAFIAEMLGLNTFEEFNGKTTVEKEQLILERIGALREKSYLELEFFLANYFLNNKVFESLKSVSTTTKNEDLTFCRGYLLKFVKDIYAKNSRYPDAFKKYAIWGEVLNECNLAPIYLPGMAQIKTSTPEIKAEQMILANILKSKEVKTNSLNMIFSTKTPNIIQSLISHTLFIAKAIDNNEQVVFDLDSINNSLLTLDKILNSSDVNPDNASALNFADHLWFELYLPLRNSMLNKRTHFQEYFKSEEKRRTLHPFLIAIGNEVIIKNSGEDLKGFLGNTLQLKPSVFNQKWTLMKDNLVALSFVKNLSRANLNEESFTQLHLLKNRIDQNIFRAQKLQQINGQSNSSDRLYNTLSQQNLDSIFVEAGQIPDLNQINLSDKKIYSNPLSKLVSDHDNIEVNLQNLKSAYLDFTPTSVNFVLPQTVPFAYVLPKYIIASTSKTTVNEKTDLGCSEYDTPENNCDGGDGTGRKRLGHCGGNPKCTAYYAYIFDVKTILPSRPLQPQKTNKAADGIRLSLLNTSGSTTIDLVLFANGENGYKGAQGTDSPLCLNKIYNAFTKNKNGTFIVKSNALYNSNEALFNNIPNSTANVEAGLSGDGGDGGRGGIVAVKGNASQLSIIAIGGLGGDVGDAAECSTVADRSRPFLNETSKQSLLGSKGRNGINGQIKVEEMGL